MICQEHGNWLNGTNLPATMVAELKLNSVIPSPDTIEEVRKSLRLNPLRQSLI
jgi:hypothetical protein